jgi:hypothetical protein
MKTPEELRAEAERLRDLAEDIGEDSPTAADYFAKRASWCDYLAKSLESDESE